MTQTTALSRKSALKSPQTVAEFEQWLIGNKLKRGFEFRNDVKIYKGEQICHARPALPDFEFKTEDLFFIPTI
jgi:hypothetical protein